MRSSDGHTGQGALGHGHETCTRHSRAWCGVVRSNHVSRSDAEGTVRAADQNKRIITKTKDPAPPHHLAAPDKRVDLTSPDNRR